MFNYNLPTKLYSGMISEVISLYGVGCTLYLVDKIDENNTKVFGDTVRVKYRDQVYISLLPKDVPNIEKINGLFALPGLEDAKFFISVEDMKRLAINEPSDILESIVEFPDDSLYVIKHVNIRPEGIVYHKLLGNSSAYELTLKSYQQHIIDADQTKPNLIKDNITAFIQGNGVKVADLF